MAEAILTEQTLPFSYVDSLGAYAYLSDAGFLFLEEGKAYTVVWDGAEYPCEAFAASNGSIAVGNPMAFGGADNEMPFIIASNPTNGGTTIACFVTNASHTVAVYSAEEPGGDTDETVGIVLKDRDGKPWTHDVDAVRFVTADGGTQKFINSAALPIDAETIIVPTFSDGKNMVVDPEPGTRFSKVTVQKPDALIPTNIAEGVDIAGIVGTFAGGSKMVANGWYFTGTGSAVTVEHGLGVTPDFVVVTKVTDASTATKNKAYVVWAVGYSNTGKNKYAGGCYQRGSRQTYNGSSFSSTTAQQTINSITTTGTSTDIYICKANDKTFQVGHTNLVTCSGQNYYWMAVGTLP